jgi:hypothetical protein
VDRLGLTLGPPGDIVQVAEGIDVDDVDEGRGEELRLSVHTQRSAIGCLTHHVLRERSEHVPRVSLLSQSRAGLSRLT